MGHIGNMFKLSYYSTFEVLLLYTKVSLVDRMKESFWPHWGEEIEQAKQQRYLSTGTG